MPDMSRESSKQLKEKIILLSQNGFKGKQIAKVLHVTESYITQVLQAQPKIKQVTISKEMKKVVAIRDNSQCQKKMKGCHKKKHLRIYHIDEDMANKNLNNLLTVCISCLTS